MTTLREAAQQALEALAAIDKDFKSHGRQHWPEAVKARAAIAALRAALAEPPVDDPHRDHWVAIAEAAQKIAASKECGPMEAKALCAALDRLTEAMLAESEERNFCPRCGKRANGIHTCTPPHEEYFCDTHCTWADHAPGCVRAEPVQEPVTWGVDWGRDGDQSCVSIIKKHADGTAEVVAVEYSPPQRKPLTEEEIDSIWDSEKAFADIYAIARAIERAHGIT